MDSIYLQIVWWLCMVHTYHGAVYSLAQLKFHFLLGDNLQHLHQPCVAGNVYIYISRPNL